MASDTSLKQLMINEMRDLYHAEKQLTKALPQLAKHATSAELRSLLETHLEETNQQIERLEQAFEMVGQPAKTKACAGMAGIVEEGSSLIQEDFDGPVLDAGIIAGAQRAEHYEIAAYGSIMAWAKALGLNDVAELLDETLEEEKAADEKLSALAESEINVSAAEGAEQEPSEDEEGTTSGSRRGR